MSFAFPAVRGPEAKRGSPLDIYPLLPIKIVSAESSLTGLAPTYPIRQLAVQYGCRGISWTYNEPAIWFEHTLESARLAKESNLYTVYVTNGYASHISTAASGQSQSVGTVIILGSP